MKKILFFGLLCAFSACKLDKQEEQSNLIVCTTTIIADCLQQMMGKEFNVVALMGPGVDPHTYNPRPKDIKLLNSASAVVYNGFHLEGKMAELFHRLGKRKKVIAVADFFPVKNKIYIEEKSVDPHIWFRVNAWLGAIHKVSKQLLSHATRNTPKNQGIYLTNVANKVDQLKNQLSAIPREQRVLITSHDAFHYFSKEFNIEVKALQGVSTVQEPGVRDLINLTDFIVKRKIKSIFIEHSVNPKAIQTVISSCKHKGHHVKIGGTLYSDALGNPNGEAGTYDKMLTYNALTIINGLKN